MDNRHPAVQGRVSMLAQRSQYEKNLLLTDYSTSPGRLPMTHRLQTLNDEYQSIARESYLMDVWDDNQADTCFSKKANEDDYPLDMKSLMMDPNNNYNIAEAATVTFQNQLIAVLAKFTIQVGEFMSYADVLKVQLTCREANKMAAKRLKKLVIRLGHLDAKLRPKLWQNTFKAYSKVI